MVKNRKKYQKNGKKQPFLPYFSPKIQFRAVGAKNIHTFVYKLNFYYIYKGKKKMRTYSTGRFYVNFRMKNNYVRKEGSLRIL